MKFALCTHVHAYTHAVKINLKLGILKTLIEAGRLIFKNKVNINTASFWQQTYSINIDIQGNLWKRHKKRRIKIGIIKPGLYYCITRKFKNWQHQETLEMKVSKEDLKGINASYRDTHL